MQDPHWASYTKHCSPCVSNFTYIVHLEAGVEEELVLSLTGLGQVVGGVRTMNPTTGGATERRLEEFIGMLGCHQVRGLERRYWADLVLFQYDMTSINKWANRGKGCLN